MKIIAGNWKMNGTPGENSARLREIKAAVKEGENRVIVFPPFLSVPDAAAILKDTAIGVGGQNCHPRPSGAYTGEVSAAMLKDAGCGYCLVGHSERRQYFGESDAFLREKVIAVTEAGMIPVFCVGESEAEREDGSYGQVLRRQIENALGGLALTKETFFLAYEPVWAIGTGKTATPEDADETMGMIRSILKETGLPEDLYLLYGGSAKPANAASLLSRKNIDGLLIGGASLKPADFAAMAAYTDGDE
ncbi:MAG: triose-phosphate isomerase [Bacillota bacterium]|jgi:triosephosphate isomerase